MQCGQAPGQALDDIRWLVEDADKPLRLVWIDDVFFPPESFRPTAMDPAIGHRAIEAVLQLNDIPPDLPSQFQWLLAIRQLCINLNIAFAVTNFRYCEDPQNFEQLDGDRTLFLVDIQNRCVEDDPEWYGYQFVSSLQLSLESIKFHTRYCDLDGAQRKFPNLHINRDSYIQPSVDTSQLEQWIDSCLLHPDPVICNAVRFYSLPWKDNWSRKWEHDDLQDRNSIQLQELSRWLDLPIEDVAARDGEAAKCLLLWDGSRRIRGTWTGRNPHREGRAMSGKVLKAVLKKLQIELANANEISDEEWFCFPSTPCFPFLVSIRSLLWMMEREGKSPRGIYFIKKSPDPDIYLFSLELLDRYNENELDPWGLATKFYKQIDLRSAVSKLLADYDKSANAATLVNGLRGLISKENTTSLYLRDLSHSKTIGLNPRFWQTTTYYLDLFREMSDIPLVALGFGPHYVHIKWTAASPPW